jgi:uroporphyrinogen decarboxylase
MVKKYFVPRYKKINDLLRKNNVDVIFLDSDGDIHELIPLFLDSGINGVLPIEVNAGMDVVKLRKEYKNDLLLLGGIDKMEIARGKEAIKAEVDSKIKPIIDIGGFIPTIDHLAPPDISLEDFKYYIDLKKEILKG